MPSIGNDEFKLIEEIFLQNDFKKQIIDQKILNSTPIWQCLLIGGAIIIYQLENINKMYYVFKTLFIDANHVLYPSKDKYNDKKFSHCLICWANCK